jgi:hypothetical protein
MKWVYLCPECIIRKYKRLSDGFKKQVAEHVGHCSECYEMTRMQVSEE